MQAAHQLSQLRDDLHKIIIGDLLQHNQNVVVHDLSRPARSVPFIAHEETLDAVIATITYSISGEEFSLDVRMVNDKMIVITVRMYGPPIEGLI